jgi:hypothetical protein
MTGLQSLAGIVEAAEAIHAEAAAGTRRSVAAGGIVVERLVAALSIPEAMAVQADCARESYQALLAGASRINRRYADLARQAYRPFEDMIARTR